MKRRAWTARRRLGGDPARHAPGGDGTVVVRRTVSEGRAAEPGDRGSSTAEVAVLLPAIAVLLVVGLGIGSVGVGQIQIEEGARAAARELARGESPETATAAARRHAGGDARISISPGAEYSTASISRSIRIPGVGAELLTLEATAQARTEASFDAG
ncbi:TadE family type IV pilus minor pilin [Zhihengliuella sp.]|uniref:TadE family type IV pilus minor pilin n=1 Tax=Zhihengliuella sp. TaxID=1954483 RepID=UPI002810EB3A|nr:TadE family type IV pilus minor pilin [Zhihengliuella sp.]